MTPAVATYTPQADITTYELAKSLSIAHDYFHSTIIDKDQFDMLDGGVKRHFVVVVLDPAEAPPEDPDPAL